ncbi:hypothetical protein ABZ297_05190 [Nonomuraea sp. NPDC005983]|uniref:hypothetical protein n=1 Tax=Nonomuraea sp. NPDC005983 TaxID=3155595 RepID=UPI0033B93D15
MLKRIAVLLAGAVTAVVIVSPAQADEDLPWGGGTYEAIGPYRDPWTCESARRNDVYVTNRECYNLAAPWNGQSWYYTRMH